MMEVPNFKPCKGKIIISFTTEQLATFNVRIFGDKQLTIVDTFNPDFHSIEEAVIVAVHPEQQELKAGDSVLVDYAVFTAGRHSDRMNNNASRLIYRGADYSLYWCYDDLHASDSAEIFATLDDQGNIKAFGDAVIIYPIEAKPPKLIEAVSDMADLHWLPHTERARVCASPVDAIKPDDEIIFEPGLSPSIFFRGIEMKYINLPYIFGVVRPDKPFCVELF